jgi:fructose-1,6-bisphosphatase I/sedoheptulose-1,7-bisphosphatase
MPLTGRWTLTRYLIEERRRFPDARGDLNALILDVALACKAIARRVAFGALLEAPREPADDGAGGATTADGPLCALSHDVFVRMNEWNGQLAGLASAAQASPVQIPGSYPRGKYLLLFEPLGGASNVDADVAVGSVFSILRAPADAAGGGRDVVEADFLQPGATQVAAGYAIHGPSTMLVLTVGNGVAGFTLNPDLGEFVLTHPRLAVRPDTREFAIDSSNSRFWEPPVRRYVDECLAGRSGPRGKDFDMRWIASPVAEAHRILMRGGVFLQPRDARDAADDSRPRLLFAANPIAFLIEQAGGRASTGRQPVLGVAPTALRQRIGFVFGSRDEVERIERYHADPARGNEMPLFAERGLFRS